MFAVAGFAFWACICLLVYCYAGFPLLVGVVGKVRGRWVVQGTVTPRVSLLIAAFNEQDEIASRLDDALAVDYPRDALEIIVASDGSDDSTESIVEAFQPHGVKLLRLARHGKIAAVNEAVKQATGDVLVFSDANIRFHPQALRALVRNFADPEVGGVAGHTTYQLPSNGESSSHGENLYWRYDTWLKEMESRTGSVISAHGGLYAVRRELYQAPSESAVTDDFAISTAVVEQGWRLVFEREALAYELAIPKAGKEFQRKVRLMTRGWRSVAMRRRLLNPFRYGFYSVVLFSHKVLRRLLSLFLLVLFSCSLMLAPRGSVYLVAAGGQIFFYGLAALGFAARRAPLGQSKTLFIPFYFCLANTAALIALFRFLRGERIEFWQPQRHATAG